VTWASTTSSARASTRPFFTPSGEDKWTLHVFDMASQRLSSAEGTVSDWKLSANREQMIVRKGNAYSVGAVGTIAASKTLGARVNLDQMAYRVSPVRRVDADLQRHLRWYRDFFYDANMHGNDWRAIGDKFRAMLPALNNRTDLNWLLSQMVGELCVSHTYVSGGDFSPASTPQTLVYTGYLGAEHRARRERLPEAGAHPRADPYNRDITGPLARPDVDVRDGDFLHRDRRARPQGRHAVPHLQVTRGQRVTVTVAARPPPPARDLRARADPERIRPALQPVGSRTTSPPSRRPRMATWGTCTSPR